MKRPNFESIFDKKSDFCEKSSSTPVKSFVPHQAISLRELVSRFERGQRLNVHQNFRPMDNFTDGKIYEESFEDAPPHDITDVTDVHNYYRAHQEHVKHYKQRKIDEKAEKAKANKAAEETKPAPAESQPKD